MPKNSLFFAFIFTFCLITNGFCQSALIPLNADYYHIIDRYEIKSGALLSNIFTSQKPFDRKNLGKFVDSLSKTKLIETEVDEYNLQYIKNDNWEWIKPDLSTLREGNFLKPIYEHQSDFYSKENSEFGIHINPILYFTGGFDNKNIFWQNSRGLDIRGSISKKLGFYSQLTENQTVLPSYLQAFFNENNALSGQATWKPYKLNGFDYLMGRGYITFSPLKAINIQFGIDETFIGSGIRSLILSNNSSPALFLKISTQINRFQYINQFTELSDNQNIRPFNGIISKKYMVMHRLGYNITKKLNIGLTETVVFGRPNQFELNYLNPLIFYRFAESYVGSPDNAMIAFDFKWIPKKRVAVYGQFLLDEFILKQLLSKNGNYNNKFAWQIGAKFVDLFELKNLDLNIEYNLARPYTFSHFNSSGNFAHFNQSLAHPLGSNFKEFVTNIRWQPLPKLNVTFTYMKANLGKDRPDQNWGGNILKSYDTHVRDNGNYIGQGLNTTLNFLDLRLSYQLKHNFFIDLSQIYRNSTNERSKDISYMKSLSIRWNIAHKQIAL